MKLAKNLPIPEPFVPLRSVDAFRQYIHVHFKKGTFTNNYQMPETFAGSIAANSLNYLTVHNNLFLLLKKDNYFQLYYYINNFGEGITLWPNMPIVLEIVYRGLQHYPLDLVSYWEGFGFNKHIARDFMIAFINELPEVPTANSSIEIVKATNYTEATFVQQCMKTALDPYTGDQKSIQELMESIRTLNLYLAYWNNQPAGFLRQEVRNETAHLGHLVVHNQFRGKGVAQQLVYRFLKDSYKKTPSRYQLWVIQNNTSAVNLYRKFGFIYGGKSTQSLVRNVEK